MKREVALAVIVGAIAGLAGAWSARREAPQAVEAPKPAEVDSEAPVRPALGGRVVQPAATTALLRVQVTPPRATTLRLSRASGRDWVTLPDQRLDGRLELSVAPGTYWLSAGATHVTVEVATVTDLTLELQPGEFVTGRVLEAGTDRPIAHALVTAAPAAHAPESEKRTVETDGLGRFLVDELPKGSVQLDVSAPGYLAASTTAPAPGSTDVRLEKSCRVDGVVVNGEGASVGGTRETDPTTIAGEGGRFWLELDCGGATLIARDVSGRVGSAKVAFGQRTVTLRLEDGVHLQGRVRTREGEAVANAELSAGFGDDDVRARASSDELGAFSLGPLLPGTYVVRARKGRGTFGAVYGADVPAAEPLTVVVEPGAALEGEVLGADDPVSVEVTWPSLRRERAVRAQTLGGRFRFEDLPAGAATITASVPGRSADRRVFLVAGGTQALRLELESHGRIVGRVSGPGAPGARVVAYRHLREAEQSKSAYAAADGSFALEVPAGDWRVGATGKGSAVLRFDVSVLVVAGQDAHIDLELNTDGGEGWGPMASVARGEVGASYENVNGSVQVSWVVADSPISAAGLRVGDVITAIDGAPVSNALDAFSRTRGKPGAKVAITWRRDGVERTADVALAP